MRIGPNLCSYRARFWLTVLMMSNTDVGGIRTRATWRCGARITIWPSAVRASDGGWLLTKKSNVNSCRVCQIARPLA